MTKPSPARYCTTNWSSYTAALRKRGSHQLAGHRAHRFGASSETAEQLQLAL